MAVAIFCLSAQSAEAQNNGGFIAPMDIPIQLSGNYGELRTNHFHSGVDIRVGGVAGEPIKAMADGYISRIFVSPYGYGKALYIAHPNGYTTVYGHLDGFNSTLTEYTRTRQYSRKSFNVDLYPEAGVLKVKQGDIVGYAGNSGSSAGAHLHLDVRHSSNAVPLNSIVRGFVKVVDNIAPTVVTVYRIEVDTLAGAERHQITATYTTTQRSDGKYTIKEVDKVNLRRKGYFAIEVRGRKNANSFSMGAYKVDQRLDGVPNFSLTLDEISFANTRYSNAVGVYTLRSKANDVYALTRLEGNKVPIYSNLVNDGILSLEAGQTKSLEIVVADDSGNASTLVFDIYGYPYSEAELAQQAIDNDKYVLETYGTAKPFVARYGRELSFQYNRVRVTIPENALYKSMLVNAKEEPQDERSLMPYYTIGTPDEPLHKAISVSLDCSGLEHHGRKLRVAAVSSRGALYSVGGKLNGSRLEFTTTTFGKFTVVTDEVAPKITPKWSAGANLSGHKSMSITISDDFSGVNTYSVKIDGAWAMFDYDAKNSLLTHTFDDSRHSYKNGSRHEVEIVVSDGCGNTKTLNSHFIR